MKMKLQSLLPLEANVSMLYSTSWVCCCHGNKHTYLVVVTWSTVEKEELSVGGTTTVTMVTARHIARQPANKQQKQLTSLSPSNYSSCICQHEYVNPIWRPWNESGPTIQELSARNNKMVGTLPRYNTMKCQLQSMSGTSLGTCCKMSAIVQNKFQVSYLPRNVNKCQVSYLGTYIIWQVDMKLSNVIYMTCSRYDWNNLVPLT